MAYEFFKSLTEGRVHKHMDFQHMDISIEIPAGGKRTGTNRAGEKWENKIDDHYGYIKGTHSPDGEHLDCYVRKNPDKDAQIYVMHQLTVDGSKFDEDKVMLGYSSAAEARKAFKKFTFKPDVMCGGDTEFTLEHFLVIAFQASKSKAMLTDMETYEDFKKRDLLPAGVQSPIAVAKKVSEGMQTEAAPDYKYEIFDKHTGRVVGKATTLSGARASVDRRDNAYGAYRYGQRPIKGINDVSEDDGSTGLRSDVSNGDTHMAEDDEMTKYTVPSVRDIAAKLAALQERQDPYGLMEFARDGEPGGGGGEEARYVTCDWGYVDFIEMCKEHLGWTFSYHDGEPALMKNGMVIHKMREHDGYSGGHAFNYTAFTVSGDVDEAELTEVLSGFECSLADLDETLMSVNPPKKRRKGATLAGWGAYGWYGHNCDDGDSDTTDSSDVGGSFDGGGDAGGMGEDIGQDRVSSSAWIGRAQMYRKSGNKAMASFAMGRAHLQRQAELKASQPKLSEELLDEAKTMVVSSDKFTWGGKFATAEISDLGFRMWPKCFGIKSTRTGETMYFIQSGEQVKDASGEDLQAVEYICPGSGIKPVHILND